MQETHPERDNIEDRLARETDLRLIHSAGGYGLAIAARKDFDIKSKSQTTLQERSRLFNAVCNIGGENSMTAYRLRARGMLQATLTTPDGYVFTAATTHPTVPVKPYTRTKQIKRLGEELENIDGPFIIGGDMNHWPGPRVADLRMCELAGLQRTDLQGETTYRIEDSNHSWIGRIAFVRSRAAGELDALLYKGDSLAIIGSRVIDIASDHRAIIANFELQ